MDEFVEAGMEAGGRWTASQLQSFLNGLRSTKVGSGVLGGKVSPVKIDLEGLLKSGSGMNMVRQPIASTPFNIQNIKPAVPRGGGALFPPGSKRKN